MLDSLEDNQMPEGSEVGFEPTDTVAEADLSEGVEPVEQAPVEDTGAPVEESTIEGLFEVDGRQITLEEAQKGYLRQSDYTRKTQALADQQRQLQAAAAIRDALDRNPEAALAALAEAYGVQFGSQVTEAVAAADPWLEEPVATIPPEVQAKLDRLDRFVAEQQQREVFTQIESQLVELESTFGDFDQEQLLAHAISRGFDDLRTAYADLHFNELAELKRAAQVNSQRVAAKRQAQVVEAAPTKSASVSAPPTEKFETFRDAYLAAKQQLSS